MTRARLRRLRRSVPPDVRAAAGAAACRSIAALDEVAAATPRRIALSIPHDGEIDVTGVATRLRSAGWTTWLPVAGPAGAMAFRPWRAGDRLDPGRFGVPVPPDDGRTDVGADALGVVVAPCVAVDLLGTRWGFGAGYYDRALGSVVDRPLVVVAAFDLQVVDQPLATHPWDVPADVVVTERRTIRFAPAD